MVWQLILALSTHVQINKLEETIQDLNDRLSEADLRQDRVLKEKNTIIRMKDDEIAELKSKIDDMAEEFGEMLRVSSPHRLVSCCDGVALIHFIFVFSSCYYAFSHIIGNLGEDA
jgi:hypothetical protein